MEGNNENVPSKRYKNDDPALQATTSEMLKYWYQKADDKTKKKFNEYLKSQQ
ncbi:DUF2057 family protein [Klebsiella pneumoniae]